MKKAKRKHKNIIEKCCVMLLLCFINIRNITLLYYYYFFIYRLIDRYISIPLNIKESKYFHNKIIK